MAADLQPEWICGLPRSWSYGLTRDGRVFFVNEEAKSTTWLHPLSGEAVITGHRKTPDLPTGWEEGYTFEGARCFIKLGLALNQHHVMYMNRREKEMHIIWAVFGKLGKANGFTVCSALHKQGQQLELRVSRIGLVPKDVQNFAFLIASFVLVLSTSTVIGTASTLAIRRR
ncbi:uncharacterized protein LOC133478613 isoform X8 [Phyllopteryx taeniolatus]|uniref:uncharacterized protein LOC133478613 isoform X8 n=1 Tax=Phyllopteryx taeniolatus TaxID=161469 RepID=UPI002AD47C87|nr:uncharacterized protein LOC133478613 isoform X8 [Phyllopteryx taeniolatus]